MKKYEGADKDLLSLSICSDLSLVNLVYRVQIFAWSPSNTQCHIRNLTFAEWTRTTEFKCVYNLYILK